MTIGIHEKKYSRMRGEGKEVKEKPGGGGGGGLEQVARGGGTCIW